MCIRDSIRTVMEWLDERERKPKASKVARGMHIAVNKARERLTVVDKERLGILRDEAPALLKTRFPLNNRALDLVDWKRINAKGRDFSKASLIDANLRSANLEDADLWLAHLECSSLQQARLDHSDMDYAYLACASLSEAHLEYESLELSLIHI